MIKGDFSTNLIHKNLISGIFLLLSWPINETKNLSILQREIFHLPILHNSILGGLIIKFCFIFDFATHSQFRLLQQFFTFFFLSFLFKAQYETSTRMNYNQSFVLLLNIYQRNHKRVPSLIKNPSSFTTIENLIEWTTYYVPSKHKKKKKELLYIIVTNFPFSFSLQHPCWSVSTPHNNSRFFFPPKNFLPFPLF